MKVYGSPEGKKIAGKITQKKTKTIKENNGGNTLKKPNKNNRWKILLCYQPARIPAAAKVKKEQMAGVLPNHNHSSLKSMKKQPGKIAQKIHKKRKQWRQYL